MPSWLLTRLRILRTEKKKLRFLSSQDPTFTHTQGSLLTASQRHRHDFAGREALILLPIISWCPTGRHNNELENLNTFLYFVLSGISGPHNFQNFKWTLGSTCTKELVPD